MSDPDVQALPQMTESQTTGSESTGSEPVDGHPEDSVDAAGGAGVELLEREGDAAADYLEGLLDIADLDGDIDIDVEGDRASISIIGDNLSVLIGEGGATLEALQELARLAAARETGERSRLMLDVGGFRARRRSELDALGQRTAEQVVAEQKPVELAPMTAFERKVVHDAVSRVAGVRSESEGVEPNRRIVVHPA